MVLHDAACSQELVGSQSAGPPGRKSCEVQFSHASRTARPGVWNSGWCLRKGRVELCIPNLTVRETQLRIGTSHFESAPQDVALRRRQFLTAARLLTFPRTHELTESTAFSRTSVDEFAAFLDARAESCIESTDIAEVPPSILCGDTNIESYDELAPLLQTPLGYVDTFTAIHQRGAIDAAAQEKEIYDTHPTFGTTYTEDPTPVPPKRIDYILAHRGGYSRLQVLTAETIGAEPCKGLGADNQVREARCEGGKGGKMYPSDHLGVLVEMQFTEL